MNLFSIKNWELQVEEQAWGLKPFKKILDRDKTKDKSIAMKEMLYIYYFADLRSDYAIISNEEDRSKDIIKNVGLKPTWKCDNVVADAILFYKERSVTAIGELYLAAVDSVQGVKNYLKRTDSLLTERDESGRPVTKVADITRALKDIKTIMQDLKAAEKEVLKEKKETEGRTKGSKSFGFYEDGV